MNRVASAPQHHRIAGFEAKSEGVRSHIGPGFVNDADDAKSNYLANYEKGWENGRRIDVSTTNLEDFEKWISSSHRKTKPFAEYKGVKIDEVQSASH